MAAYLQEIPSDIERFCERVFTRPDSVRNANPGFVATLASLHEQGLK